MGMGLSETVSLVIGICGASLSIIAVRLSIKFYRAALKPLLRRAVELRQIVTAPALGTVVPAPVRFPSAPATLTFIRTGCKNSTDFSLSNGSVIRGFQTVPRWSKPCKRPLIQDYLHLHRAKSEEPAVPCARMYAE